MKKLPLLALCSFLALTTSCKKTQENEENNKIKSITVKPKTTVIKGDLGEYFVVVENDYEIKLEENSFNGEGIISVEVKRTAKDFNFSTDNINPFGTDGSENYHVGFGIEIFGESSPKVIKQATEGGLAGVYDSEDIIALMKLKKGETGFIRWSVEMSEGLKTFQLSSALQKSDGSFVVSENNDETLLNSGSEDYDKMLQNYDEYVTEYIKFYKKAMKGDNTAMSEYPAMMEKANALQESMQEAQGNNQLSVKQIAKMSEIQTKMLKGMQ
jgi:hypothetical protein